MAEEGIGLVRAERKRLEWARKNEPTYRAMVQLKFPGDPGQAFEYWERYKGASSQRAYQERTRHAAIVPNLPAARSLLGKDTAVLSYVLFDAGTAIWIYDTNGIQSRWIDVPKSRITLLAQRFGEHCSDPRSDVKTLRRDAWQLYELIFLPIAPLLRDHKHIIIEADGVLDLVPFEALVDKKGRYVADSYSLSFSAGLYYLAAARPWQGISERSRVLVVGDPAAGGWSVLPTAETEARDVAAFFADSRLLLRYDANYPAIARELPQAEVFHFSGHATASANTAGPVLAGSDLLDVIKLEALHFPHNKLVVLSACSSAQGTAGMFNDVNSTARLLIGAGVPELVASRWGVDSSATARLMREFYTELLVGKSVADSLRAAGASLREQNGTAHPFYWASFAAFGRG